MTSPSKSPMPTCEIRSPAWDGSAEIVGNTILDARPLNFLNRDKTLDRSGDAGLSWKALTTGNHGGFDLLLADAEAGSRHRSSPLKSRSRASV